jgi:L-ascorbate metabolism protein UlaG (beta-lactamase superfamily)
MMRLKINPGISLLPLFLFITGFLSCCSPQDRAASDHFNGKTYYNREGDSHTFTGMVKWLWEMDTVKWPEWIDDPVQPKPEPHAPEGHIRATYINHSTILIQTDKLNILTDPIWSMRAGPYSWLGSKRIRKPGVDMNDLPEIDIVLISHDHYDHLDIPTLKKLYARKKFIAVTGQGNGKLLKDEGIDNVIELDWWQEHPVTGDMKVTFVPSLHNSGRGMFDSNCTLWGGFVIQAGKSNIYFAGDTGYGKFLDDIHKRFPQFALAILPVGNYEKRWFMKNQHMNPDDAVKAHILLRSGQSIGMHYATFNEHPEQAVDAHEKDLAKALGDHGLQPKDFRILKFGEGITVKVNK